MRIRLLILVTFLVYSTPLVMLQSVVAYKATRYTEKDLKCLTDNLYFEARGEGIVGMFAVASVVLNRLAHEAFPSTICEIVYQPYQFSWTSNKKQKMLDKESAKVARQVALQALTTGLDFTDGALYFHRMTLRKPKWTRALRRTVTVNSHVFYTQVISGAKSKRLT